MRARSGAGGKRSSDTVLKWRTDRNRPEGSVKEESIFHSTHRAKNDDRPEHAATVALKNRVPLRRLLERCIAAAIPETRH